MTTRALRPCPGDPLCPELVPAGEYCPAHRNRSPERRRPTSNARGYDVEWFKTRARYLRDHAPRNAAGEPVCEECGRSASEVGAPLEVDHLDGLGPNGPRGHDPDNLQALCPTHHGQKTRAQAPR